MLLATTPISAECTPSACSSSSARPVRRPTVLTSGTCNRRRSASRPTLLESASEIPGRNSIEMVSVPSLNDGRNDLGSSVAETLPAGVILTICSFAVAAIFTRQRFLALLTRTEGVRLTLGWWMELFGALGVLALGLAMLTRT